MAKKLTPAQRRALIWLANAGVDPAWRKCGDWMFEANVSKQTVNNLVFDRLVAVKYATVWASGKCPIDMVRINANGRAAIQPYCQHDWRQAEIDRQQCERCNATRVVAGIEGY